MQGSGTRALVASLLLASASAALSAEDAKPTVPSLADVLGASGVTATGYIDSTYSYVALAPPGGDSRDASSFALNQAALSLAYTPNAGFGARVHAVAGTEACNGCYAPGYAYPYPYDTVAANGSSASTSSFNLLQAYAQYVAGKATWYVGKFTTLAGAEVAAPTGNSNVTRSLLFWYAEPLTHVGARLAYAATGKVTVTAGVNNGWNNDASGSARTCEFSAGLAPSKTVSLAATAYYTASDNNAGDNAGARTLIDLVATWNVTPALTLIASADWDRQERAFATEAGPRSATWWGVAGYVNYAIDAAWRVSVRGEHLEDEDGYVLGTAGIRVKGSEGTLTVAYAPAPHFEARLEGRYDRYRSDGSSSLDATQLWLQALYKF